MDDEDDELLVQGATLVVRSHRARPRCCNASSGVGFARPVDLMDLLERAGVVGPSEGSKARPC